VSITVMLQEQPVHNFKHNQLRFGGNLSSSVDTSVYRSTLSKVCHSILYCMINELMKRTFYILNSILC